MRYADDAAFGDDPTVEELRRRLDEAQARLALTEQRLQQIREHPLIAAGRFVRRSVARIRTPNRKRHAAGSEGDVDRPGLLRALESLYAELRAEGVENKPEKFAKVAHERLGINGPAIAAELSSAAREEQLPTDAVEALLSGWIRYGPASFSALFELAAISDLRGDPVEGLVRWRMADAALRPEVSEDVAATVRRRVSALSEMLSHSEGISDDAYEEWIKASAVTQVDLPLTGSSGERFLVIVRHPSDAHQSRLDVTLDSVLSQAHGAWQAAVLHVPGRGGQSSRPEVAGESERRSFRTGSGADFARDSSVSTACSRLLTTSEYDWAMIVESGDLLAPDASAAIASLIGGSTDLSEGAGIIYFDEDSRNSDARRHNPYFKPPVITDVLWSHDVVGAAVLFGARTVQELGGLTAGLQHAYVWDFALRAWRAGSKFHHLPRVLLHRSGREHHDQSPTVLLSQQVERRKVVQRSLAEHGLVGDMRGIGSSDYLQIKLRIPSSAPSVAIIIPTRDGLDVLRPCLESIFSFTDYGAFSVSVIDNGSQMTETREYLEFVQAKHGVSVRRVDEPFNFSRLLNLGVYESNADVVVSMNNDIVVLQNDWLEPLVANAVRPEVGAVGPRLLYPDGSVQHAGVTLGRGGIAGHAYARANRETLGYRGEAVIQREVSAVTGAVLAVERRKYLDSGGFDEINFAVALNDVDFCLRLRERGLKNIFVPSVELIHVESHTRESDIAGKGAERFKREAECLRQRHSTALRHDPLTSPNRRISLGEYVI